MATPDIHLLAIENRANPGLSVDFSAITRTLNSSTSYTASAELRLNQRAARAANQFRRGSKTSGRRCSSACPVLFFRKTSSRSIKRQNIETGKRSP